MDQIKVNDQYQYSSLTLFSFYLTSFLTLYLVKQYGATPGKFLMGICIIRKDGNRAGWNEAIGRDSVSLLFGISYLFVNLWLVFYVVEIDFNSPLYEGQIATAMQENTLFFFFYFPALYAIWGLSELLVLLFDSRKRALHDYIGQTVVVYKNQLPAIKEWQESRETFSMMEV